MPDWENLRYLGALAKGGSLSAAARHLNVEHATVARRVAALEAELGVRVVDRRGRRLLLTPQGLHLATIAERMEQEAMAAERLAAASREAISGTVILSAPPAYAAAVLITPLTRLQAAHPALTIELIGEMRTASLDRREADIAVRLDRPRDGNLTIVRLGTVSFDLYATSDYAAATPPPDWVFTGYSDDLMRESPQARHLQNITHGRPVRFLANTLEMQIAFARSGAGVALLPDFLAATDAELVQVSGDIPAFKREIWLVVHTDIRTAPAVHAVAEALKIVHHR